MAAHGEYGLPTPDFAVFADTQGEPESVYSWLNWLNEILPYPVYSATYGNLGDEALKVRKSGKTGLNYTRSLIPVYTWNPDGSKGMLTRSCTRDYKIYVVQREIRRRLEKKRITKRDGLLVEQWIGISTDEAHRMKPAPVPWIVNRWPLIENDLSRADCLRWMEAQGYPKPPRSACVFCPYHSDTEWLRLKTEEPEAFEAAAVWEDRYQEVAIMQDERMRGIPFMHKSLIPIREVQFDPTAVKDQFGNECEGMCGV